MTESNGYDNSDRLTSSSRSDSNSIAFTYDTDGNRTGGTLNGVATSYSVSGTSNRLNSVDTRGFGYTGSGAESTDGTRSYLTDEFGRLTQVTSAGAVIANYRYNALSQRVYKASPSGTSYFAYDLQSDLYAETGAYPIDYVWLAGQVVGLIQSGNFYAVHSDHLGRPETVTGPNGQAAWHATNLPFDRIVQFNSLPVNLNIGFPGQYYDSETNLWYNGSRYYDATIGRYIQSDKLGLKAGVNTYVYTGNNAISGTDPYGLYTLQVGFAGNIVSPVGGIMFGFGVAFSSEGLTGYSYGGLGGGGGLNIGGGLSVQGSNAPRVDDLAGPFTNTSLSGGFGFGGTADAFEGSSDDGDVWGGGFTLGEDVGASLLVGQTATYLTGTFNPATWLSALFGGSGCK